MSKRTLAFVVVPLIICLAAAAAYYLSRPRHTNWNEYLGGPDRNHFSELTQINPENVARLQVAWTYSTADSGQLQVNPLIIDGVLYGVSPAVEAFALDAATGKELWSFRSMPKGFISTSRGVSYWEKGADKRILFCAGSFLWALDAKTGKPVLSFGDSGKVDLHTGLPEVAKDKFIMSNTPGTIFEDLIVLPVRLSESEDAAPGDIRAFSVITGKPVWTFHTIPYPGEEGYETFPPDAHLNQGIGAANCWAGMSIDRKRGMLFVPTGSAAYDFYGGNRTGQNLFANCLLALDVRTGKKIWHFQTTHHDIWDRDLPAPPNLMTIQREGKKLDVVAQVSKQGYVYVFERTTGKPVFPIVEKAFPDSGLPGEKLWPTQPIPQQPAPFARQSPTITADQISPYAQNRAELAEQLAHMKTGVYEPSYLGSALLLPGYDGGAEWGGAAADPEGILYVNSNEMAWVLTMEKTPGLFSSVSLSRGHQLFNAYCATCHGAGLQGNPASQIPALAGIGAKYSPAQLEAIIQAGKGKMPGVPVLKAEDRKAVIEFLTDKGHQDKKAGSGDALPFRLPYHSTGYNKFLDNRGLPAIAPPWGKLSAINLNTGNFEWSIPFGWEPLLDSTLGIRNTGSENYGGPVVTASGLLFIAATKDGHLRAFDKKNGKLLWETKLPFPGFATPATYSVNGKQYVVVACGGAKLGMGAGNKYVAYCLPDEK